MFNVFGLEAGFRRVQWVIIFIICFDWFRTIAILDTREKDVYFINNE